MKKGFPLYTTKFILAYTFKSKVLNKENYFGRSRMKNDFYLKSLTLNFQQMLEKIEHDFSWRATRELTLSVSGIYLIAVGVNFDTKTVASNKNGRKSPWGFFYPRWINILLCDENSICCIAQSVRDFIMLNKMGVREENMRGMFIAIFNFLMGLLRWILRLYVLVYVIWLFDAGKWGN